MDIKKYFEERIQKRESEFAQTEARCLGRIAQLEAEREFMQTSPIFPEKTDTLDRLKAADGKRVLLHDPSGWDVTATMHFTGTRIEADYTSYPIIGDSDSGLSKITTIEGNEVVFENPYKDQSIPYQTAMLLGRQAGLQEAQIQIDSQKRSIEYWKKDLQDLKDGQAKVPAYIERASKLIYPQRMEQFEQCACVRVTDLYRGMDLENALQIMEALDNGATVEEAGKLIDDGHSGTSYGVTMSIVLTFSKRGVEFCKANHSSYRYCVEKGDTEAVAKWTEKFDEIEAENKQYEKESKTATGGKGGDGGKK